MQKELRYLTSGIEIRATESAGSSRTIRGYASLFNSPSEDLGGFTEIINEGAFDGVLGNDTRALFNHDPNQILARSRGSESDTMRIGTDERGLWYEFDAPQTRAGDDILESIRRGDVDQSSFGFIVAENGDNWTEKREAGKRIVTRTINKIARLLDISVVTYPAYPDTSVALRSMEAALKETPPEPTPEPSPTENQPPELRWHPSLGLYETEADQTTETK